MEHKVVVIVVTLIEMVLMNHTTMVMEQFISHFTKFEKQFNLCDEIYFQIGCQIVDIAAVVVVVVDMALRIIICGRATPAIAMTKIGTMHKADHTIDPNDPNTTIETVDTAEEDTAAAAVTEVEVTMPMGMMKSASVHGIKPTGT